MLDGDEQFRKAMLEARKAKGIPQQALADALTKSGSPMHLTAIGKVERGERRVTIGEALVIAHTLGIGLPGVRTDAENATLRRRHERIKAIIDGQEG